MNQMQAPPSQQYSQPAISGATTGAPGSGEQTQSRSPQQSQPTEQSLAGGQTPSQAPAQGAAPQQGGMGAATWPVGRRFGTRSYLPEGVRTQSIGVLNQCLVDLVATSMQLKDAHWNVKGVEFYQLHELFEDIAATFEPHVDAVAERASALGGQALATPRDVVENASVPPLSREAVDGRSILAELARTLSALDVSIERGIESANQQQDFDTADLLNEVSRDVSKALWFLEAHLQSPGVGRTATRPGTDGAFSGQAGGIATSQQ